MDDNPVGTSQEGEVLFNDDIEHAQEWGEALPKGWYKVRLDKWEEKPSDSSEYRCFWLYFKVQDEPFVGQTLLDIISRHPKSIGKLKTYYKKGGYTDWRGGHSPNKILDHEYFVYVDHDTYKGRIMARIDPGKIRAVSESVPTGDVPF
jgi:hypothetical protein